MVSYRFQRRLFYYIVEKLFCFCFVRVVICIFYVPNYFIAVVRVTAVAIQIARVAHAQAAKRVIYGLGKVCLCIVP